MKTFLAVYTGSKSSRATSEWDSLDPKTQKEREAAAMDEWSKWATKNAGSIVDNGAPLGTTKRVDRGGVSDTHNDIAAYVIVQADSHEAAADLFVNHPHFTIFPGDAVEIMECLPMPEMPNA
jgi:hypothetical protein